ncbi:MAG: hypothetical protein R3C15_20180 [Thermoleophilia bacterium]
MRLERLVLTPLRAAQGRRQRRAAGEPRIAGVLAVRDYDPTCGVLDALRALADVVIVLDDGSTAPLRRDDRIDELVRLERRGGWNDAANRLLLLQRAFVHGCGWLVCLDDDLIPSAGLRTRDDAAREIDALRRRRADVGRVPVRDLWESADRFRVDGVWGRKSYPLLRRNWLADGSITLPDPARRLHAPVFPRNLRARAVVLDHLAVYHTGCLTHEDRAARVERYARADPRNEFQRDYAYMLDERGLALAPVPAADAPLLAALRRDAGERDAS